VKGPYDAVLIVAGAMTFFAARDTMSCRKHSSSSSDARSGGAAGDCRQQRQRGGAPLFSWPLNWVLSRRSLRVRRIFALTCRQMRAQFVNLTFVPERDHFARHRELYFAEDGLHPRRQPTRTATAR